MSTKNQNRLLLAASYFFYGFWDWRFLGLILFSSLVDYKVGKELYRTDSTKKRRLLLLASLSTNLGLLGFFKYYNFFLDSLLALFGEIGISLSLPTLQLILPVGISFYTFQTLSYTIDIYRRELRPTEDLIAFLSFVSFFPQLVAGPIERAARLLPQFQERRRFVTAAANRGLRHIIYGLFLKKVIANNLAPLVDSVYDDPTGRSGWDCWMATYQFAFQIYADFAGYSHIAIGSAALLGIRLSRNFAFPYLSTSIGEFWTRWHISLSTWFRDYVYIPMGGSRVSPARTQFNLVFTFLVSGLWHGAAWRFVVWGLLHGILACCWRSKRKSESVFKEAVGRLLTFQLVCLAWVFFRADDVFVAAKMVRAMVWDLCLRIVNSPLIAWSELNQSLADLSSAYSLLLMFWVVLMEGLRWRSKDPLYSDSLSTKKHWLLSFIFLTIICLLGYVGEVPFIYFQF